MQNRPRLTRLTSSNSTVSSTNVDLENGSRCQKVLTGDNVLLLGCQKSAMDAGPWLPQSNWVSIQGLRSGGQTAWLLRIFVMEQIVFGQKFWKVTVMHSDLKGGIKCVPAVFSIHGARSCCVRDAPCTSTCFSCTKHGAPRRLACVPSPRCAAAPRAHQVV